MPRLLVRSAFEVGPRAERVALVREDDEADVVVLHGLLDVVTERVHQLDRQRVAIVGTNQRDRCDAAMNGIQRGVVAHANWPGLRPAPGGPAKAWAIVSHSSATAPVASTSVSSR